MYIAATIWVVIMLVIAFISAIFGTFLTIKVITASIFSFQIFASFGIAFAIVTTLIVVAYLTEELRVPK